MAKATGEAAALDAAEPLETSTLRDKLRTLVTSNTWEAVNGGIIMFNLVIIVLETDIDASSGDSPFWLLAVNYGLSIIFAVELALTCYVFRYDMFKDKIMLLDAGLVLADSLGTFISLVFSDMPVNFSVMRIVRLLRMTKTRKLSIMFPELRMLGTSIVGAMKPLFWGAMLIGLMLVVWSILAVQILQPLNEQIEHGDCERCPRAFASVWQSMITFTQGILLGDSWGLHAVPLLEAYPPTAIFLCCVVVTLDIALLNVLMASVVDSAQQARLDNDAYMAGIRLEEEEQAKQKFIGMCKGMDEDGSGMLTFAELETGHHNNEHFRNVLESMDIHEADLKIVWDILDEDNSGDLSYLEFTDELFKMKSSDSHTTLMFVKHYVQDIRSAMGKSLAVMKDEICTNITKMMQVEQKEVDMLEAEKLELERVEQSLLENQEQEKKELEVVEKELLEDQKKEMAEMEKLEEVIQNSARAGRKSNPPGSTAKSGRPVQSGASPKDDSATSQLLKDIYAIVTEVKVLLMGTPLTLGQQDGTSTTTSSALEVVRLQEVRSSSRYAQVKQQLEVNSASQGTWPSAGWCGIQTADQDRRGYIVSPPPLPSVSSMPGTS